MTQPARKRQREPIRVAPSQGRPDPRSAPEVLRLLMQAKETKK